MTHDFSEMSQTLDAAQAKLQRLLGTEPRYFVDDRTGCIAVRDRRWTDPEYQGLHRDTVGVVRFWMKHQREVRCEACNQRIRFEFVDGEEVAEANALAERLNAEATTFDPIELGM